MILTPYHARYFASLLSHRSVGMERYLPALASSGIDLHPHQIDAAVFASRSPYRDGVILADEEGLGKTVEAGIVLLQAWLEGRARLLVLCPPGLVEHWKGELADKFALPVVDINAVKVDGGVVILSFQKAVKVASTLARIAWDQCVIDEAHQLANAGPGESSQAMAIRQALSGQPKLLLTATPMQNTLLDLYHLIRMVDETVILGDAEAFRARYMAKKAFREELASRAQTICQRTLRRQALTMPVIRRQVKTIMVGPTPEEMALSQRLSAFFHRERLVSFPDVKEHRIRLTYWKMLASSPQTLAVSLRRLTKRLADRSEADDERRELEALATQADNLPGARLGMFLRNLSESMAALKEAGAPHKAVIFSDYRHTLEQLAVLLADNGYRDMIALCTDSTGSKMALTAFRLGEVKLLLTTDGGATGRDLSHCSLVVNYDLPWNVQKLEQRISRCHRYGQKHDVHVLNFIDPTNRADRRLYDSINKKLRKFDDLFGASETVLGQIENAGSAPVEIRGAETVAHDRSAAAEKHHAEIQEQVTQAERDLLAYFDEDVRERFRKYDEPVRVALSRIDDWLWYLTRYRLGHHAQFDDEKRSFVLDKSPYPGLRLPGIVFGMDRSLPTGQRYHMGHPLAIRILEDCLNGELRTGNLALQAKGDISAGLSGTLGLWQVYLYSDVMTRSETVFCGMAQDGEVLDHERCAAIMRLPPLSCDGGMRWSEGQEISHRGRIWRTVDADREPRPHVKSPLDPCRDAALQTVRQRLAAEHDVVLRQEVERLDQWAVDEEAAIRARLEELRKRIDETKNKAAGTSAFVQRFRTSQKAATMVDSHRKEEEKIASLMTEVRRRRDERIEQARQRSKVSFLDDEMFVVHFRIENGDT